MGVADPTLFALILLIINGGLQWIRELRKGKLTSGNGKDLTEIKTDIKSVDRKVDSFGLKMVEIKTAVDGQKTNCATTIKRFDQAISNQNKELMSLAKNSGRKR